MTTTKSPRNLAAAALTLLLQAVPAALADTPATRYYEDAVARYHAGDYAAALIQLKNVMRTDPGNLPAQILVGRTLLAIGKPQGAEEQFVIARDLGADPKLIAAPLAQARNRQGRFQAVVDELRPTDHPPAAQPELWVQLGEAHLGLGDAVAAEIAFDAALRLAPGLPEARSGKARILIEQGKHAQAAPTVAQLLQQRPDDPQVQFLAGALRHAEGAYDEAVAHFREAAALDPGEARASLGEALALLESGAEAAAVPLLERVRAERPTSLQAHYLLARALRALDRHAEAATALREASDLIGPIGPAELRRSPNLLLLTATVLFDNAEYQRAYGYLDEYLRQRPHDLPANKQMAKLLEAMDKPVEAVRLLTRLAAMHPDDLQLMVMLGDASVGLNDLATADRYYRAALERAQGDPRLLTRLGLLQYRRGQPQQAIDRLEAIARRSGPDGGPASLFLGILLFTENRLDAARAVAERSVAEAPHNLLARNLLAAIAIAQGDPGAGREILTGILAERPDFVPARVNLAKLDILEGHLAQAGAALNALLLSDPDNPVVLRERARLALARGDRAAAVQALEAVRDADPKALRALLELTELYLAEDRRDDALRTVQELDARFPNSPPVLRMLARVRLLRGELAQARSTLREAAVLAGQQPRELLRVAELQTRAGVHDDALLSLEQALLLEPGMSGAQLAKARITAQRGGLEEAARLAAAALKQSPDDGGALTLLGDIRLAQGQPAAAAELYRRVLLQTPDAAEPAVRLYRATVAAGRADAAAAELRAWLARHPDQPLAVATLASHAYGHGDHDAARDLYERLVELTPQDAHAHNNLANLLIGVDNERALRTARYAHELAPDSAAVLDTLGWILVQLGELERGLAHLRDALARNSAEPSIRYHLGVALEEYGYPDEARAQLQQALATGTEFPGRAAAEQRLQRLQRLRGD